MGAAAKCSFIPNAVSYQMRFRSRARVAAPIKARKGTVNREMHAFPKDKRWNHAFGHRGGQTRNDKMAP